MLGRAVSFSTKNFQGYWGEGFLNMKNSFLLINILPTSLQIKISSDLEIALGC